MADIAETLTKH